MKYVIRNKYNLMVVCKINFDELPKGYYWSKVYNIDKAHLFANIAEANDNLFCAADDCEWPIENVEVVNNEKAADDLDNMASSFN